MRAARKVEPLYNSANEFCGFFLAADFCAEHEWGIDKMQRQLDMNPKIMGIGGRTINQTSSDVINLHETNRATYLCVSQWFADRLDRLDKHSELYRTRESALPFVAAWNGEDFCITAFQKEGKEQLKLLYQAMMAKDCAVFLGGKSDNPFDRGGLTVCIVSKVDKEHIDAIMAYDIQTKPE
jgi:hypothetical protein